MAKSTSVQPKRLTRFAWLSIVAALLTMGLKTFAYVLTGSVGLLSDAIESLVNLVAAIVALLVLSFAAKPADQTHPFGHGKIEYFASGFEGALILVAAGSIAWTAYERLSQPVVLQAVDAGLAVSVLAGLVNLLVGVALMRAGRRYHSITLEADGRHLMSDVWTTVAILLALVGVMFTAHTGALPSGGNRVSRSADAGFGATAPCDLARAGPWILDGSARARSFGTHRTGYRCCGSPCLGSDSSGADRRSGVVCT